MDRLFRRSLKQSQALWAHNLWELCCAGFRHSASFHARVILDMALLVDWEKVGEVDDALIVLSRLCCVFWCRGRVNEEDDVLVAHGR